MNCTIILKTNISTHAEIRARKRTTFAISAVRLQFKVHKVTQKGFAFVMEKKVHF